jgi:hypothetical protein
MGRVSSSVVFNDVSHVRDMMMKLERVFLSLMNCLCVLFVVNLFFMKSRTSFSVEQILSVVSLTRYLVRGSSCSFDHFVVVQLS